MASVRGLIWRAAGIDVFLGVAEIGSISFLERSLEHAENEQQSELAAEPEAGNEKKGKGGNDYG